MDVQPKPPTDKTKPEALRFALDKIQKVLSGELPQIPLDPDFELQPGATAAGFIIQRRIGVGSMGEVWEGLRPATGQRAALKVLNKNLIIHRNVVTRFLQEVKALNEIRHPNLIEVHAVGILPDGRPYFAMEFLEGQTLSAFLKEKGPLPFSLIEALLVQLCGALQAAHNAGVVHRDLKPDNLFLVLQGGEPRYIKVLDFGIAKLTGDEESEHLTKTGEVFGTPAYMAPEQCEGSRDIDHRADIYSLGIIVFEMIAGRTPFYEPGEKFGTVMMKQLSAAPPPLATAVEGRALPGHIDHFIGWVLAKKSSERPARCVDLLQRFQEMVGPLRSEGWAAVTRARPLYGPQRDFAEEMRQLVSSGKHNTIPLEDAATPGSLPLPEAIALRPEPSRRAGWLLLGGSLGLIGLVALWLSSSPAPGPSAAISPPTPTASAPAPRPSLPTAPASSPTPISLTLRSTPSGAKVMRGEQSLGETPLATTLPAHDQPVQLILVKEGYEPHELSFVPTAAFQADVHLKRTKPKTDPDKKLPKEPPPPSVDEITTNPFQKK